MQFCPIVPTKFLTRFCSNRTTHFCLAQWLLRDRVYTAWFKRAGDAGHTIILDNGAYEGERVKHTDLIWLAREINATWVVVPDELNDWRSTRVLERAFLQTCREMNYPHEKLMMPIHRAKHERITENYRVVERAIDATQRYHAVALPRALERQRLPAAEALCSLSHRPYIHCLGWTTSFDEIAALARCGVDSLDTSAPGWRGLYRGHPTPWPVKPSIDPEFGDETFIAQAGENIRGFDVLCKLP